tara:strand:- start:152 stop:1015 length:864 start_codon:yes stop_codon:yes gene_type:complete
MDINIRTHNKEIKKGLYLIPTPIGNLEDITFRAVNILKKSDYILCEDTRVSKILFRKYEIKTKLIANHKFNETKNLPKIIELLKNGALVSLISDAGTPCVSDPGKILLNECIKKNIDVYFLPGPSSVTTAISASGFSEKFFFYGFFPEKKKDLKEDLNNLSKLNSCLVFFVSSKKINKIIPYLKTNFAGRKILICREMTKYFEEFIREEVNSIKKFDTQLKGELTIVISEKKSIKKSSYNLSESDKRLISKMINKISTKEIAKLIGEEKKISKKEIYDYCLKLKDEN